MTKSHKKLQRRCKAKMVLEFFVTLGESLLVTFGVYVAGKIVKQLFSD